MGTEKTNFRGQSTALGNLGAAIERALEEAPAADVLSVLTGAFVGLTVELVRRQGHDVTRPITVDGGKNRDITVHAPKGPAELPTAQDTGDAPLLPV